MKLKQIIFLLLAVIMLCSLTACDMQPKADVSAEISDVSLSDSTSDKVQGGTLTVGLPTAGVPDNIYLPDSIDPSLLQALQNRLNEAEFSCALYYVDLETGFRISYNEERFYRGASIVKAPFLVCIFDMIQRGELSYDDTISYEKKHWASGTTIIVKQPYGTVYTVRSLIEHVVWYSDNCAYLMLRDKLSTSAFRRVAKSEYNTDFYVTGSPYNGLNWLNARGVGTFFNVIYDRYKANDEDFRWYVSLLLNANENKFVRGGLPKDENGDYLYKVAHKYGMDINSSHDGAIVFYKDRPYVLVILTDYIGIRTQSFMNKVSANVFDIHQALCGTTAS